MMSGAPLITMRETKFNNNSHFKTLSDEDLFTDEVEPLNSILSKFKYWPRNGNKIYTKKSMLFCGFLLFTFGFLIGFFIFGRISFSFNVLPADRTISIHDVQEIFQRSINVHQTDSNASNRITIYTNYEEALLLKQHFEKYQFDEISPISTSNLLLTFKNKYSPDALEIVVDKGELRYRNARNATYTYVIPDDASEIKNVTNRVSGLPVYGNYGTLDDFNYLMEKGISLRGCIILLRLGKIPILEKVTTALKRGVNGVLLFADPQQYPYVDMFTVTEEISPTLLANLQKVYNSLEIRQQDALYDNNGIPVQIIEAMTAQNILREMAVINKSPDSWRGSLNALYSIGPGFVFQSGNLILYSYFINVNYTSYDIAAYLKGSHEHDRYIILGNRRRTLKNDEKTFGSTSTLMEVSKTLSELKINEGWNPKRTVVFCSFGLEEAEMYSEDSWAQMNKHIIKERAVTYLDIRKSMSGLEYLNVKSSPILMDLFERVSALVENPNAEEKVGERKSLFDVWRLQKKFIYSDYRQQILNSKTNLTRSQINPKFESSDSEIENRLFDSFEIPILSVGYTNEENKPNTNENASGAVNIFEYENAIDQLWTLLTFSHANSLLIPLNISAYGSILNNFYEKLYSENEKHLKNINIIDSFKHFGDSLSNLASNITSFQSNFQTFDDYKLLELRILNDKLMQIYRLLRCNELNEVDKLPISIETQYPVFLSLQQALSGAQSNTSNLKEALKKSHNCVDEINFLLNEVSS
ncbi:glutamate carboxypeptidase 2-like isoform X2 [Planococcus citri]|uniref:glutamate carboxypeptidase 2-like isoform X2 n=1 Tax=Planococcus citri TaxID=170843 RepID=UPI0031F8E35B